MSEDTKLDEFVETESGSSERETEDLARKTVCGIPPQDWTVARLGELVRVVSGNSLPTEYQNGKEGEHPVYKVSDMNATGNQKYVSDTSNRLLKEDLEEINHTLYPEGTTILPKVGAALLTNKRRLLTESSSFDNNVMGWVPDEINPEFLYYVSCMIDMEAVAQKGAVPSISKAIAKSLKIPSPPLPEQRKIATVLSTVDRAIEKTEEIVEQTETTKQALSQSLFMNGYYDHKEIVDAHHQNRLSQHPNEWKTKPAGNVLDVTRGAHPRPKSDDSLWGGKIPIVKISDRNRGDSRTIISTDDTVTEKGSQNSKLVAEGTLIVSNAGTVGAARITGMETCIHDHWLILRNYEEGLSKRYLYHYINWNQDFLEAIASGSTVLDLNTDDFRLFDITFPSLEEQQKIADVLDSLHEQKIVNVEYADRLRHFKLGLQRDLLSGTVRTTDTNIEVPDEIAQHG